ncbi:MAG: hypothetical protein J1E64_15060 [Acetatifactor sp.]|nr:hypothetical protein [Acetatifactor sp.]
MDITKLEHKSKSLFAIKLAEKASSYLQESNARSLINKAIEVSWKWIHTEEKVGAKYFPEPIEIVDDNIFTHMVHSLTLCDDMEREYIEEVYQKCLEEVE